jgi:membrane-associated phospholipid phosphatase
MHILILLAALPLSPVQTSEDSQVQQPARSQDKQGQAEPRKDDMVLRWNELTLAAIRRESTPPPVAARNLAIVHASIFDAVNEITVTCRRFRVQIRPLPGASPEAAAAAAAHRALVALYPRLQATWDQALAESLAGLPDGDGKLFGRDLGIFVADRMLAWRSDDGMDRSVSYDPQAAPGVWQRTPPGFAEPLLPQWRHLTPFAVDHGRIAVKDPPRLTDPEYTTAFKEVKQLGRADSKTRTKEQTEIAEFWADGAGTSTPPGHWNQIARTVARKRGTSLAENARLFALLNLALADAGILCWDCKYKLAYWRPVTGIQNADQDGNPDTDADRAWTPLLTTPPFPSYVSGHSSFSGAGAAVLADVFGDKVAFETTSEGLPGVTRSFKSFWAAAAEAGQSRIYGGIHWQFDNTEGLAAGRALARLVCRGYLLAQNADQPARHGEP